MSRKTNILENVIRVLLVLDIVFLVWLLGKIPTTRKPAPTSTFTPVCIIPLESKYYSAFYEEPDPLVEDINIVREDRGLAEVEWNTRLAEATLIRAVRLQTTGQWSHEGLKDTTGYWALKIGIGENLARNFSNNARLLEAWENSPKHAEILFNPNYKYIGVGRYKNYTVLWMSKNKPCE